MNFTSTIFLFIFLPIAIISYYIIPKKFKNIWLCLLSLIFYAWGGLAYVILIMGLTIFNYIFGRLVNNKSRSKLYLIISICFNIGILSFFKYFNFFIDSISGLIRLFIPDFVIAAPIIPLPIGISFFTFKIISYIIDIYKGEIKSEKNFVNFSLYVLLFPQLLAGPIDRYKSLEQQIKNTKFEWDRFHLGLTRFIIGISKKVIIANTMAKIANFAFDNSSNLNTSISWLGIIGYSLQIYFDFSGYSDMAIGIGKMLGFDFMENFNYPYISKSIQEFWRRWHISLSTWFKDYVYIPLGGNRKGKIRTYYNMFIVFLLTGLWHGASWNFVIWGLFHGVFLIIERMGLNNILKRMPNFFSHIYTIIVVMIGWVFFRASNLQEAIYYIKNMFSFNFIGCERILMIIDNKIIITFILAIIFSIPTSIKLKNVFEKNKNIHSALIGTIVNELVLVILYILSLAYISGSNFNPFIYFKF